MKTIDYARLLKHLGFALLFAPEPFSTPFGVAFILVARHLSKRLEATRNVRLREMVRYYLTHSSLFGTDADVTFGLSRSPKRSIVSEGLPILGQITGSRDFGARLPGQPSKLVVLQGGTDGVAAMQNPPPRRGPGYGLSDAPTRTQKVTYHRIDIERLSRRYGKARCEAACPSRPRSLGDSQNAPQGSKPTSAHRRTDPVGQLGRKCRARDGEAVQGSDKAAASRTRVLDAVQSNNHYYDMLSKGNIIGGY